MVDLLEGSPISTRIFCQSDPLVPAHLPGQGPPSLIAQFGRATRSTKILGGSILFFGTCEAAEIFPYLSTDVCLE